MKKPVVKFKWEISTLLTRQKKYITKNWNYIIFNGTVLELKIVMNNWGTFLKNFLFRPILKDILKMWLMKNFKLPPRNRRKSKNQWTIPMKSWKEFSVPMISKIKIAVQKKPCYKQFLLDLVWFVFLRWRKKMLYGRVRLVIVLFIWIAFNVGLKIVFFKWGFYTINSISKNIDRRRRIMIIFICVKNRPFFTSL